MDFITLASFFAALLLVLVHFFAGRLRFLGGVPRSRWLSAAGGVSVAYVFVHLLPELSKAQETIAEAAGNIFIFIESHVYLMALAGLIAFYGLEMMAVKSRNFPERGKEATEVHVFWVHILSFAFYNCLIGYFLLHRTDQNLKGLILFTVAMLLHFIVNDYSLREHHRAMYKRAGRWILAGAVLLGWAIGLFIEISEVLPAGLLAFLAGGIILNVLKEELPEERKSRFSAFVLGAGAYAALLITF